MGWNNQEVKTKKKGMETSSKILLAIITCIVLIILLIFILLLNLETTTFNISLDGQNVTTVARETLLTKINDITYVNIEEFAKLVKYEYHQGEYKEYELDKNKCYVQGNNETASFYLNENKVLKLQVNKLNEEYNEYLVENPIKKIEERIYAPLDAIKIAFNVQITEDTSSLAIFSLEYLAKWYDENIITKKWGYTSIVEQSFENKKSILYDRFIVKKENGLYKIVDKDEKEIVSDKYNSIEFSENTKEFFVTNSLGQVGIVNLDGTMKIEPIYNSISVLDKESDLYLIQKDEKYGVIKSGNIIIINTEYDNIGLTFDSEKKYVILDTLIPVCKNEKWGAFDKNGNLVYKLEYESLGGNFTTVEFNGTKKTVNPVLTIEACKGIVVKKAGKYGLLNLKGETIIPIRVESIYSIEKEKNEIEYFMIYNNKELNIIKMLIEQGIIEDTTKSETQVGNNTVSESTNIIKNQNTTFKETTNTTSSNNIAQ